jgi:putative transposase
MSFIRKHPTHLPNIERHNQAIIIFLTVCTKDRRALLANEAMCRLLVSAWEVAATWSVGQYMIMPDHIHLFCSPRDVESPNVKVWSAFWKGLVSRAIKGYGPVAEVWRGSGGTSPSRGEDIMADPLWQAHCWDTQLRSVDHYAEKWEYVRKNAVRKGLTATPEEWPFQGCLTELRW